MKKDIDGESENEPEEEEETPQASAQKFELKPVTGDEQ